MRVRPEAPMLRPSRHSIERLECVKGNIDKDLSIRLRELKSPNQKGKVILRGRPKWTGR